jgi:hypothetical protein
LKITIASFTRAVRRSSRCLNNSLHSAAVRSCAASRASVSSLDICTRSTPAIPRDSSPGDFTASAGDFPVVPSFLSTRHGPKNHAATNSNNPHTNAGTSDVFSFFGMG